MYNAVYCVIWFTMYKHNFTFILFVMATHLFDVW